MSTDDMGTDDILRTVIASGADVLDAYRKKKGIKPPPPKKGTKKVEVHWFVGGKDLGTHDHELSEDERNFWNI